MECLKVDPLLLSHELIENCEVSMSEEVLLETPLAAEHVALGAKMVPFRRLEYAGAVCRWNSCGA